MTKEERKLALYCLKANSDLHGEVCEECSQYPECDHFIQDNVMEKLIEELEQEPCEDAISREQAINQCGFGMTSLLIADNLRKLPPVTPQPKTGHWISLDDFRGKYNENGFVCSSCGGHSDYEENFCPDCGRRMTDVPDINDGKMSEIPTGSESEAQE